MSKNNRDRVRDPREEILLETNFEDDGVLTRAYNQHKPNRHRSAAYRSDHSLDRYSERGWDNERGKCCTKCMSRMPYATLIATLMCWLGVGIFIGTSYRGSTVSTIMFDIVFRVRVTWIDTTQLWLMILSVGVAALGFVILFVGFLTTGATRYKVYRAWGTRVGGRITCAVLMGITYALHLTWVLILCFMAIVTFCYTTFWGLCEAAEKNLACIDMTQFYFLFPEETDKNVLRICEKHLIKAFCKDTVEIAEVMFALATASGLLIVLSLVHYLICLSANYTHIRDLEKFNELQEMHNLKQLQYSETSKDRF